VDIIPIAQLAFENTGIHAVAAIGYGARYAGAFPFSELFYVR
jgi:hypothetical protein